MWEANPSGEENAKVVAGTSTGENRHPTSEPAGIADQSHPIPLSAMGKRTLGKRGLHPGDMIDPRYADRQESRNLLKLIAAVGLVLLACGIVAWIMCGGGFPLPW